MGARRVLSAAALTYVAALLTSVVQLLRSSCSCRAQRAGGPAMMTANAREVALEVLTACRKADAWADGALKSTLGRAKLDSRDAALATALTYGVIQNRMLLDFRIGEVLQKRGGQPGTGDPGYPPHRACQILLMDKIPHSAAVNQAVEMAKGHHRARAAGLVNAVLRNLSRTRIRLNCQRISPSVTATLSGWWTGILRCWAERKQSRPWRKTTGWRLCRSREILCAVRRQSWKRELPEARAHPWLPDCYTISGSGDLQHLPAFRRGFFFVQDAAAKLACLAAGCKSGDMVIDVCARTGREVLRHAAAMGDEGKILACDIHPASSGKWSRGPARLGSHVSHAPGGWKSLPAGTGGARGCGDLRCALFRSGNYPQEAGYPL